METMNFRVSLFSIARMFLGGENRFDVFVVVCLIAILCSCCFVKMGFGVVVQMHEFIGMQESVVSKFVVLSN